MIGVVGWVMLHVLVFFDSMRLICLPTYFGKSIDNDDLSLTQIVLAPTTILSFLRVIKRPLVFFLRPNHIVLHRDNATVLQFRFY